MYLEKEEEVDKNNIVEIMKEKIKIYYQELIAGNIKFKEPEKENNQNI